MFFRGFRIFEYALHQKRKTRICRKPTEIFLNQKIHIAKRPTITHKKIFESNSSFHVK